MAGSPNFPSDNAQFYFYKNTPTSFADSDLEPITKSPNMGPSSSRSQISIRKGLWEYDNFMILSKFLIKELVRFVKIAKIIFLVKLQGGRGDESFEKARQTYCKSI